MCPFWLSISDEYFLLSSALLIISEVSQPRYVIDEDVLRRNAPFRLDRPSGFYLIN